MAEVGYDLAGHRSDSVDEFATDRFDLVATMGCGDECPMIAANIREDWSIPDPKDLDADQFREVRDIVELHVRSALARLGIDATA